MAIFAYRICCPECYQNDFIFWLVPQRYETHFILLKFQGDDHFTYHRESWISTKKKIKTRDKENAECRDILNPLTEKKKKETNQVHSGLICLENMILNWYAIPV